jgi:chemotaxis family two-component system sensor histidine kinase/response regulator PixL
LLPLVRISELLDYNHYLSEQSSWKINEDRDSQTKIILIARSQDRLVAVESCLSNMVAKPQLAIEPFEHNLNSPPYCYGCTLWQDNLVLVIDGAALLESAIALDKKNKTKFFYLHQPSNNYLPDASTTNTYNKPTILVVDDSRTLRQIIIYTLEKGGYQIAEAANGREAIAQLHQNSEIRLVISDIDMPTMNGLEFLDYCRRDPKLAQVPVVMLSSHNSIGAIQKVSRLGAKAYFTKPYQESELLAKVKTMIG